MKGKQQSILLDEIGGEPLEGSGFESEESLTEDEVVVQGSFDQREEEL